MIACALEENALAAVATALVKNERWTPRPRPGVRADPVASALRDERAKRYGVRSQRRDPSTPVEGETPQVPLGETLGDAQRVQASRAQMKMEEALREARLEDEAESEEDEETRAARVRTTALAKDDSGYFGFVG